MCVPEHNKTFRQDFAKFQDNLYNLKGASEDDSSFKASDESEDSDNSNSDDGRDVEEITPSPFGRELVDHEDAESLPSGPGAPTSTPGNSDFNDVHERTRKLNMVDESPHILLVDTIDHPPLDPITQKKTFGGSIHYTNSLYPFVESYKTVLAWVYAGLLNEDAKTLALDHNVDSKMRLSMSFLQKVRYFHNEWVDHLRQGKKADEAFKVRLCDTKIKSGSEEALKPIPEDMMITPWHSMQGIREKHIILPILARVKGGALTLDEISKEFEKQKTFLYMQRIMIEKLNCKDWNEVQTHHPTTSHHSPLERFIFLFKSGTRNLRAPIKSIPQEFEQHLGRARAERRRLEDAENIVNNPDISTFVLDDITTLSVQYSVFEGKVENMESFVPRRHYTLGIADAPYGFKAPHSINDDVKYGLSTYKKVIEAFKKVTSAESWVLVFFHAHDQISAAKKAFIILTYHFCIFYKTKPNIKGFQLDRMSFAAEFATIGFFSPIGLSCKGSFNFVAKPNRTNIFDRPGVCQKLRDLSGDSSKIMNPYQKPQLLMMDFIELLSMKGEWIIDLFARTDNYSKCFEERKNVVAVEMDPLQVRFIQQRVTALKELPDEFQEVGMKNMAAHPRVVDASGEPQPGFGPDDEMQFVDLEPYEEPNLVDATGGSGHGDGGGEDDSSPSGGEDEEDKDEDHEEFPIKP
ncbi:hypothetical protein L7F22_069158 [Adiantum nelumboides]|nr:hypothetical protein [Adiantum nelumboides]